MHLDIQLSTGYLKLYKPCIAVLNDEKLTGNDYVIWSILRWYLGGKYLFYAKV